MRTTNRALALVMIACAGALLTPRVRSQEGARLPDDPFFRRQVSFRNPGVSASFDRASRRPSARTFVLRAGIDLDVLPAWRITTGSKKVIVGILDDGFPYGHEDIRENVWRNPGESGLDDKGYPRESNGLDDDGNGYADDVVGWDWAFDDPDPDAYVFDGMRNDRVQPYGHSIAALGIIGARGDNGIGVAGINWRVSMMLLKIGAQGSWPSGKEGRCGRAARAIRYAADNGARVINWSGFVSKPTPEGIKLLEEAIGYAGSKGVLIVAGAGNFGTNIDHPGNSLVPQTLDLPNVLNVAEINLEGRLDRASGRDRVSASCWGPKRVGIAAIARNYTTDIHNACDTYRLGGGTSCAAPVVTGVAALMLAANPHLDQAALREILLATAHKLPSLAGKVTCGGMVDAGAAVAEARRRR